ncbi:MAG: ribosome biogenesis GTP-binding protein YihA/YsxC [Pseudomonadota bacterium]
MDETSQKDLEVGRLLFAGPCDFMLGVAELSQLPPMKASEVAFAGRSNVGKSSLLNALTGRRTLARTSNTPGRTQQLNFFNLGQKIYLVDMPGYGYAKVSKTKRAQWDKLIRNYLRGRQSLRSVFILVDSRHGVKDSDEELMSMLDEAAVSFRIVLTKADKAKKADLEKFDEQLQKILKKHPAAYPHFYLTSSEKKQGIEELRAVITAMA